MKNILALISVFALSATVYGQSVTLSLKNTSGKEVVDYTAEFSTAKLKHLPVGQLIAVVDGETVPVEFIRNIDGEEKIVFPIAAFKADETKKAVLKAGSADKYPKRTYAELAHKIGGHFEGTKYVGGYSWVKPNYLRVPDNFRDHAYYIKYEGPGWESDKAAFRFYLDQRNAIDVFAKKTPQIVLPFVGVDGYDSYHEMADWGMDNTNVGKALGLGSIASWDGKQAVRVEKTDSVICYIPADGKIRSQVMTVYYGWDAGSVKTTLRSLISIDAGSRASHVELKTDRPVLNLATGINKDARTEFFYRNEKGEKWSYIASFGLQSLNKDNQGLAVFVRTAQLKEITSDALNHIVLLQPDKTGYADYYILPTWELDWQPVVTKDDFIRCIDEVLARLNSIELRIEN
ncbi:MAG: DUF4861 domain-containing protein [Dysgonamonadaceae bacterium]|jgi:hypothetical protein|nr:DUF4861 domain-containing protein [Dysgonamonadaceae bacterium]